jgi:hypothetical protein
MHAALRSLHIPYYNQAGFERSMRTCWCGLLRWLARSLGLASARAVGIDSLSGTVRLAGSGKAGSTCIGMLDFGQGRPYSREPGQTGWRNGRGHHWRL